VTKAYTVADAGKRKYPRIRIFSLISYACIDDDGQILAQSYGTALDISQGGLLLETTSAIDADSILLTTIDLEDKIHELKAKVVYCKKTDTGKFRTGMSFQGTKEENIQFAAAMVRAYHSQKKKN
jgi:hypothetical protein